MRHPSAGVSVEKLGTAAACAVKRINLDKRMAMAATRQGAELREGFEVTEAELDRERGLYRVVSADVSPPQSQAQRLSAQSASEPSPVCVCACFVVNDSSHGCLLTGCAAQLPTLLAALPRGKPKDVHSSQFACCLQPVKLSLP